MAADPDPVERLLADIVDGRTIDWSKAAAAIPLSDRPLLEPLRIVAELTSSGAASDESLRGQELLEQRFELKELIGQGAFGDVYRAYDARLERDVAVKIVRGDRPFATSLIAEARRLARVHHPGVVTIYDVYDSNGTVAICMELLRGRTLDEVVRTRELSGERAAEIGERVCRALAAIHRAGLVHRDIKAHNVILEDDGRVVLMDLGAGVDAADTSAVTREGTPLYMAPELLAGGPADQRTDVYSVGVLLYFLVTRAYPVGGGSVAELRDAHTRARAENEARLHLPAALVGPGARALAFDPAHRFPTADAMGDALAGSRARRLTAGIAVAVSAALLLTVTWLVRHTTGEDAVQTTTVRQVDVPADHRGYGTLSDDARVMTYLASDGSVKLADIRSGATRLLVAGRQDGAHAVDSPRFRGRDETVVFPWTDPTCACVDVREVDVRGGKARTILRDSTWEHVFLEDVSADGTHVLVRVTPRGAAPELGVVRIDPPAYRRLIPVPLNMEGAALSPDARFIVHDGSVHGRDNAGDLFVTDTATGRTLDLLTGPADDVTPIWVPDGKSVLFTSDRAQSNGLWQLPMRDGRAAGLPVIVQRDMGRFSPLHLARGGALLHWRSPITDVEISAFDPQRQTVYGAPQIPPVRVAGANAAPAWSPDGRSLVYVSERKTFGAARSVLVLHSLQSGKEREVAVPVNGLLDPAWAPDGRTILVRGPGATDGIRGVRAIDVDTGNVRAVFPFANVANLQWTPDGRAFYLVTQKTIDRVDVDNGQRNAIDLGRWSAGPIALSPDGSMIATIARKSEAAALLLVPASGGAPRVLVPQDGRGFALRTVMDWTRDGSRLLVTRSAGQRPREAVELVTVSANDGTIQPTGLVREGLTSVRMRSDGRALAYRVGANVRTLWIIDHFLSQAPAAGTAK